MTVFNELCDYCDTPAAVLEAGKPLCENHRSTRQARFQEKKFVDFEPEDGFGTAAPVRHIEPSPFRVFDREQKQLVPVDVEPPQGREAEETMGEKDEAAEGPITAPRQTRPRILKDSLEGVNLEAAVKLHQSGKKMADVAKHYSMPVWKFAQSRRWRETRASLTATHDTPVKQDGRHAPRTTVRKVAQTIKASAPKKTREHLQSIAAGLQVKVNELTTALDAVRHALTILDRYPDILQ
jgi:hypothetical protein